VRLPGDPPAPPASAPVSYRIGFPHDAIFCSRQAMAFAAGLGFDGADLHALGIVVSELVTNVLRYAGSGLLLLRRREGPRVGVELTVEDHGPGIHDIESAMRDGYSQGRAAEEVPPGERRSLGAGLGAVRRLLHEVSIENRPEGGVRVVGTKWRSAR
jgi:serine/threonine-protein kinase RsbT